jgi:hypothetical protein
MVGFVGTVSSLTMGIQGLTSAFDEGLSPMERFTTILSSMAMLLPILNVLTEKKIKLSGMATAATISEIIAEKAKTTESKAAAVVESFRLILKEKWVGLALVAAATATAFGVSAMFSSAEEEAAALKESAAASREAADANQE